jgi:hypothetical protein
VEFDDDAQLDTSQVQDMRGAGGGAGIGGRVAMGGGGVSVVGVVIYLLFSVLGGGGSSLSSGGYGSGSSGGGGYGQVDSGGSRQLSGECKTGRDANQHVECAMVAVINSVQGYWSDEFGRSSMTYRPAQTKYFRGQIDTGCGAASADSGPFYCPADKYVYIDLSFFDELRSKFGAEGGTFVDAYVLAHEYGHHVQDLLGQESKVRTREGPKSDSVRLELQADCYAGVWANHATTEPGPGGGNPIVKNITADDVDRAVQAAQLIGDDSIQSKLGGGSPNPSTYTHGTSKQREKWLRAGLDSGDPTKCDTFSTDNLG